MKELEHKLIISIMNGNLEEIKNIIEKNDIDPHLNGDYPILVAVDYGHIEIVNYLYNLGLNIHLDNERALLMAIINQDIKMASHLINLGADIQINNGYLLKCAININNNELIDLLMNSGFKLTKSILIDILLKSNNYQNIDAIKKLIEYIFIEDNYYLDKSDHCQWKIYYYHDAENNIDTKIDIKTECSFFVGAPKNKIIAFFMIYKYFKYCPFCGLNLKIDIKTK